MISKLLLLVHGGSDCNIDFLIDLLEPLHWLFIKDVVNTWSVLKLNSGYGGDQGNDGGEFHLEIVFIIAKLYTFRLNMAFLIIRNKIKIIIIIL